MSGAIQHTECTRITLFYVYSSFFCLSFAYFVLCLLFLCFMCATRLHSNSQLYMLWHASCLFIISRLYFMQIVYMLLILFLSLFYSQRKTFGKCIQTYLYMTGWGYARHYITFTRWMYPSVGLGLVSYSVKQTLGKLCRVWESGLVRVVGHCYTSYKIRWEGYEPKLYIHFGFLS